MEAGIFLFKLYIIQLIILWAVIEICSTMMNQPKVKMKTILLWLIPFYWVFWVVFRILKIASDFWLGLGIAIHNFVNFQHEN